MFTNGKFKDLENIEISIKPDNLRFVGGNGNILKIMCYEFLDWQKEIELYLDCV